MTSMVRLRDNLARLRQRMVAACARAGRPENAVRLVAVTKSAEVDAIRGLVELGVTDLAESRPQQFLERAPQIESSVRWHFIGHLQRNKARKVLPLVECIHSVDSVRLLTFLEALAVELDLSPRVLLEVNVSGEEAKGGFAPDELLSLSDDLSRLQRLRIDGLMTMAPLVDDAEQSRPVFAGLRGFRDQLASRLPASMPLLELSMGMSGDFEPAIEEGATLVRIGSSLFEGV